jgi:hypothetical protein
LPGNVHGDLIPKFQQWVREVPASDIDTAATPAAVAAILERKAKPNGSQTNTRDARKDQRREERP